MATFNDSIDVLPSSSIAHSQYSMLYMHIFYSIIFSFFLFHAPYRRISFIGVTVSINNVILGFVPCPRRQNAFATSRCCVRARTDVFLGVFQSKLKFIRFHVWRCCCRFNVKLWPLLQSHKLLFYLRKSNACTTALMHGNMFVNSCVCVCVCTRALKVYTF